MASAICRVPIPARVRLGAKCLSVAVLTSIRAGHHGGVINQGLAAGVNGWASGQHRRQVTNFCGGASAAAGGDWTTGCDGIFPPLTGQWIVAVAVESRPIDADSRRNRANRGSSKFPFEIKSPNF